ncbi:hypothetical protein MLD38_033380 [Melastoma candidum]|uniref:Uncharacterized protein n=1 Tax=Melastoma candidum TaxID=119954 RepID=A0ACB9M6K4_9MYRT|nr:hypothetical protein MLD38_033380 [Melastoma candidum]
MALTVHERCQVSPPKGSIPATTLPLSFLDVPWFNCHPVQYIYLYDLVHPFSYLTDTALPSLKSSLCSALVDFFPFAADLLIPHHSRKAQIVYTADSSLSLTIAESAMDFNRLVSSSLQDAADVHPLVPHLPPSRISEEGDFVSPMMAIQITVFPNSGICIGVEFLHVAADGKSFQDFMKAWAGIHRSGLSSNCSDEERVRPFHDRRIIRDTNGLESIFYRRFLSSNAIPTSRSIPVDKVRGTFHLNKSQLDQLKDMVLKEASSKPRHISKFVVACAFVWHCWVSAQDKSPEDDQAHHLVFLADSRSRLGYPIPTNYFGNCLTVRFVSTSRGTLIGERGIVYAAKSIEDKVKEVEEDPLKGAEGWPDEVAEKMKPGIHLVVAGSPRFKVYDTDFGWGKPRKFHRVHLDDSNGFGMSDARQGDDTIEIDVALDKSTMEKYAALFGKLHP